MPSRRESTLQLILNADDFGLSEDTVAATIECVEAGGLTSATIMPGMPATEDAIAFALRHPELGFGVHLTVTGEHGLRPLAGAETV
ncbi:MAG TPA: ChbG/HpnK family deacetylase, partial [Gaiellaceae bacterium]|nr:ChbG/HpnK family deacetylase [Gaiellaceae bacterium]